MNKATLQHAHGVQHTRPIRARDEHLQAANEPLDGAVVPSDLSEPGEAFFAAVDAAMLRDKQADGWNRRNDERALALQQRMQDYGSMR